MKYTDYKKQVDAVFSEICNEVGLFFAFSQEQFDRQAVEGTKYINIGYGGTLPKKNKEKYLELIKKLGDWKKEAMKKLDSTEVILYELNNHEAFYTGDLYDTIEALEDFGYTKEQVAEVYIKNKGK